MTEAPKNKARRRLEKLIGSQTTSFNWFLDEGKNLALADLDPAEWSYKPENQSGSGSGSESDSDSGSDMGQDWIDDVEISSPSRNGSPLYPSECRQAAISYSGDLTARWCWQRLNAKGQPISGVQEVTRNMGKIPILVGSKACNLHGLSQADLYDVKEEGNEVGGYFIINGLEKILRMIIGQRANYPLALIRGHYAQSGPDFSHNVVTARCLRPDYTSKSFTLHFLKNGDAKVRFAITKAPIFLPFVILLRALMPITDREIYEKIIMGDYSNTFFTDRVEAMLRASNELSNGEQVERLYTQEQCLNYIGAYLRHSVEVPTRWTNEEVAKYIIRKNICVHLDDNQDKVNFLIVCLRKLYYLANEQTISENSDAVNTQEVVMPGHTYTSVFKECLQEAVRSIAYNFKAALSRRTRSKELDDPLSFEAFNVMLTKVPDIGRKISTFLATGNMNSKWSPEVKQYSGWVIMAEKLNYIRYIAHFRCIHRGQFFTQMRTTGVRKLLPSSWGFLCPVHTPDGSTCGLVNHMTRHALVSYKTFDAEKLRADLIHLGMDPVGKFMKTFTDIPVMLDGRIVGHVPNGDFLEMFEKSLRKLKVDTPEYAHLEIAFVTPAFGQFPCVYLFTKQARFLRPVTNLFTNKKEFIGSLEQTFLDIAVKWDEVTPASSHVEISPTRILSVVGGLTPFSDNNQSPRNMYQCQMLKQTIGTPCHSWPFRTDNKLYRIQNPQKPVVYNQNQNSYQLNDYLTGTNAIVAVLAHTGYDLEDAMIINKSSFERGFGHGSVYKAEHIDLAEDSERGAVRYFCGMDKNGQLVSEYLEEDGLPPIGRVMQYDEPYYAYYDAVAEKFEIVKWKIREAAYVDAIIVTSHGKEGRDLPHLQKVCIKLRVNRRPTRGDKFASRHGQKGVLSVLWPTIDMPFTETGMTPDLIINPHAFPSRMTIGMLIESMAGKSGACHGLYQDSTPFQFSEETRAVDHFGKQLIAAGYNYWGNETMYCGMSGEEFKIDIFLGVVYYQRLRHMVLDKYQARATGPRDRITHQPVKGRKRGGGIRFGEMERDSILAHGAAFLLHDRLLNSSDIHEAHVCMSCGSLLSPIRVKPTADSKAKQHCMLCNTSDTVKSIPMPYVTRYLVAELATMGIRLSFDLKPYH